MFKYIYKNFFFLTSRILILIDLIFRKIFNRYQFLPSINDYIESRQYYEKIIDNKKIIFFCPSSQSFRRVQALYKNEPETLNWIDNFQSNNFKKIVFWDVGANIGLYSIYAAVKIKDIEIISFEPSFSNTRTLSRNTFINSLDNKITIFPLALSDKANTISYLNETKFADGNAGSSFDKNIDQTGHSIKEDQIQNRYKLLGTSMDNLIQNKILTVPNYIKIDVDSIEDLILKGAENLLKNKDLKELSIEMNPTYEKKYKFINNFMQENNFKKVSSLNRNLLKDKNYKLKLNETVNEIFKRNN